MAVGEYRRLGGEKPSEKTCFLRELDLFFFVPRVLDFYSEGRKVWPYRGGSCQPWNEFVTRKVYFGMYDS